MEEQKVTETTQEAQYKVETKGISKQTFVIVIGGLVVVMLLILTIVLVVLNQNNQNANKNNVSTSSSVMSSEETSNESTSSEATTSEVTTSKQTSTTSTSKTLYTYRTNEGKYIRFKYPEGWNINVQVETESGKYFPKGITSIEISGDNKLIKTELPGGFGGTPVYKFSKDLSQVNYEKRDDVDGTLESSVITKFKQVPDKYKITSNLYLIVLKQKEGDLVEKAYLTIDNNTDYYEVQDLSGIINEKIYISTLYPTQNYFSNGESTDTKGVGILSVSKVDTTNKGEVLKIVEVLTVFLNSIEKKANVE